MEKTKICEICKTKFIVRYIYSRHKHRGVISDEGHCFSNFWFCNNCWEELQKMGFYEPIKSFNEFVKNKNNIEYILCSDYKTITRRGGDSSQR